MNWILRPVPLMTIMVCMILLALFLPFAHAAADTSITLREQPAVSPASWVYTLWTIVQPIVTLLATIIGPVVATYLAAVLIRLIGVKDENEKAKLEAQFRDALHQSALNGLKFAIAKRTGPVGDMIAGVIPDEVISDALDYVRRKNPDAVAKVDQEDLVDIIMSKAVDVQTQIAGSTLQTPQTTTEAPKPAPSKK